MVSHQRVLLGPQRLAPTLDAAVRELGIEGNIAAITAGWEERESEDDELYEHLGRRTFNLELFRRSDDVFGRDPELHVALRQRRETILRLRDLYHLRLSHALEAARELLRMEADGPLLEAEQLAAIETVRDLDAHFLARVAEIDAEHEDEWRPGERDAVARHRGEVARLVGGASAVCVAGGHVGILLERLRLFGLSEGLSDKTVLAWSAGAMALSERIVLFHDSPPQGPGDAEVFDYGLGVFRDVVPLPHARRRLSLGDRARVALFARRFGPALCVALDERTRLAWTGETWSGVEGTRRLMDTGSVAEVGA